jgi:hypothetical protein
MTMTEQAEGRDGQTNPAPHSVQARGPAGDPVEERSRLLRRFFDGPRLRTMPSKLKDKELVLEEILRRIPDRQEYTEIQLNQVLKEIYADFATVRREMVDGGLLQREGGIYRWSDKGRMARGV